MRCAGGDFESADFPGGDFAVCWLHGREATGELYGAEPHAACLARIAREGGTTIEDGWHFERYACPRFTTPDENGEVILDYGIAIK
jgi:hypothetical protein